MLVLVDTLLIYIYTFQLDKCWVLLYKYQDQLLITYFFFFTGTIKISWTWSHFIFVKWRVRHCWRIKCVRLLIAHQISSTKGVLTNCPLEAIVFLPDMNFFATWKTNETNFVIQNSNPNDKALNTLLLAKDTWPVNMLDTHLWIIIRGCLYPGLNLWHSCVSILKPLHWDKRKHLLTLTTSAEDTASIFWVTASGEW